MYGFHSLRHGYITHLIEKGVSSDIVQAAVGHSTAAQTAHYTHVTDAGIARMREALEGGTATGTTGAAGATGTTGAGSTARERIEARVSARADRVRSLLQDLTDEERAALKKALLEE